MSPRERRRAALLSKLESKGARAFVTAHAPNVRYLTGFSGSNGLLWLDRTQAHLFTDARYETQLTEEVPAGELQVTIARDGVWKACREWALQAAGGIRAVFESDRVSHHQAAHLAEWEGIEWAPERGWVEALREVKEPAEVDAIRAAVELALAALEATLERVRPGVREMEIAAELEYHVRRVAPEGVAFETIVLSGERTALPHGRSGPRALGAGDWLLIDFGATRDGYRCDLTRTYVLGPAGARQRRAYEAVCDALEAAAERARPGAEARDVDAAVRELFADRGFETAVRHSTGHGLGLEVHEGPRLHRDEGSPLRAGMVVTLEPGLYFPGWGGVRVEDDFHLTEGGAECLGPSTRTLQEL